MYIAMTQRLFAWESLQDSPSLGTIKRVLASVPDATLLEGLRAHRDRGRNDYPVHVLWGIVLLRIILRHVSFEAVLGELQRNAGLRELIGSAGSLDTTGPAPLTSPQSSATRRMRPILRVTL